MLRRSSLALLGLALLATPLVARAQSAIIPPGREAVVMSMLGGALPGGCALEGASIRPRHVEARYSCGTLELRHPNDADDALPRTAQFAVAFDGAWPAAARRAVLDRIRANEEPGFWSATTEWTEAPSLAPRPPSTALLVQYGTLAVAIALALLGLALCFRTPPAPVTAPPSDPRVRPLVALSLLAALATGAIGALTFRFAFDDYANLLIAAHFPDHPDQELRLLGVRAPFALAHLLGGSHAAFAAIDLAAWLAFVGLFAVLLGRARLARGEALLAASWAGASTYFVPLLRWGVGVQNLAVLAWIAAAMLALDEATRAPSARRRAGATLLGAAAALAAVLTKYPVAILVPVLSFVWCRSIAAADATEHRASLRASLLVHALVALGVAAPIAVRFSIGSPSSEPALRASGISAYLANLRELADRAEPMIALALALALAEAARRITRAPTPRPLGRPALALSALAVLSILPFLANRAYFTDYYPALSYAWLCALAAPAIARRMPASSALALPLALAITLLLLPWRNARPALHGGAPDDRSEAWLEAAARALGDRRPERLVLRDACPDAPDSLDTMLGAAGGHDGLRWILALPALEVVVGHDEPPTLSWCGHDDQWRLEAPP